MVMMANAFAAEKPAPTGVRPAPAFTHTRAQEWLNSKPLTWDDFRGQVVIVDIWTFACWNCYRSLPWLHSLADQYHAQGLRLLGVHTPELAQEYVRGNVVRKLTALHVDYPVMLDNDYSYWNDLGNRAWPTFYLIDKHGRIRGTFVGEIHKGDATAKAIDEAVQKLLAES